MNFKELLEKKNALVDKVNGMFTKCETEKRAFDEAEKAEFEKLTAEIRSIDETMKMYDVARSFEKSDVPAKKAERSAQAVYEAEYRAFGEYIRSSAMQYRDEAVAVDVNLTKGANGAVIPTSIANKIIETVENICPIYAMSTKYRVKGTLTFPVYDESEGGVKCDYQTEFTAMLSTSGKFTNVDLGGFLAGALTKISRSLINNSQFDIASYAIGKIAQAIARFLEREMLNGSTKIKGVMAETTVPTVTADNATKLTADDLIEVQAEVPEAFQDGCCWFMSKEVMKIVRKLKDGEGRYILQSDLTKGFGYELLGKHIYLSDQLPKTLATGVKTIAYGDFSGMYTNIHEDIDLQILREKFADEHADGVIAWLEVDGKPIEKQKLAVLKMA